MRSVFHHNGGTPEARVVEGLFRTLGGRIGAVPSGSPIPRVLRRQRWSPVNVPLVWAAAGVDQHQFWIGMIRAAERIRGVL